MRAAIFTAVPLAALGLASCGELPAIAGAPEPVRGMPAPVVMYRDLADIPARPTLHSAMEDRNDIQTLTADRARAAQEADRLRNEPFVTPAPAMKSEF